MRLFNLLGFLAGVFVSCSGYAAAMGTISRCETGDRALEVQSELKETEYVTVHNAKGETVGVLQFLAETGTDLTYLYLCGQNSETYYVTARVEDWVSEPWQSKSIGRIDNDEYDVEAVAKTITRTDLFADLVITVKITFAGEPEDADYSPAAGDLYVTLPLNR